MYHLVYIVNKQSFNFFRKVASQRDFTLFMAAFKLEASALKITSLNSGSTRPKLTAFRAVKIQSLIQYNGLLISSKPKKPLLGCRASTSEAQFEKSSDGNHEEIFPSAAVSQLIPNSSEITYLLTELCDTASIAEFQLKLGEFELHVMRNLNGKSMPPPPPITVPVTVSTTVEAPNSNSSISTPSLALSNPFMSSGAKDASLARAAEEGFVVIQSPRVGFFRRSRTLKGKSGPPCCKENQVVDEGQVLCYIDQLGGEMPVEADVSGEVVSILLEDGAPVGYGDPVIIILPSLPGMEELP